MEQVPYNISLIELEEQEGLRVCSNVLNIAPEDIYVDMPVQVTFMPTVDDPNVVLPLFVPSDQGGLGMRRSPASQLGGTGT
jgi:uncharacterized OB-fold protein